MPDTGLLPTIAMALAATVVNKKAMKATNKIATTLNSKLPSITPKKKKMKILSNVTTTPISMIFIDKSR